MGKSTTAKSEIRVRAKERREVKQPCRGVRKIAPGKGDIAIELIDGNLRDVDQDGGLPKVKSTDELGEVSLVCLFHAHAPFPGQMTIS